MPMQCKLPEETDPFPELMSVFGEVIDQDLLPNSMLDNLEAYGTKDIGQIWPTTQTWSHETAALYREAAAAAAATAPGEDNQGSFSCEDFLLAFLLEFSLKHGLPVHITNGAFPRGWNNEFNWGNHDYHDFRTVVLKTTAASDLDRNENARNLFPQQDRGNIEHLRQAQPGDLFLLDQDDNGASDHAQLVTSVEQDIITITQGNFVRNAELSCTLFGDQNNPSSFCYGGQKLAERTYQTENGSYSNGNSFIANNIRVSFWNFAHWNYMAAQTRQAVNEWRRARKQRLNYAHW